MMADFWWGEVNAYSEDRIDLEKIIKGNIKPNEERTQLKKEREKKK